jgi:hypothetical protein
MGVQWIQAKDLTVLIGHVSRSVRRYLRKSIESYRVVFSGRLQQVVEDVVDELVSVEVGSLVEELLVGLAVRPVGV